MALEVLSMKQLRELFDSIRRNHETLRGRAPHHSQIDWIKSVLADIKLVRTQSLSEAIERALDQIETALDLQLEQSQECKCTDCQKRSEAVA